MKMVGKRKWKWKMAISELLVSELLGFIFWVRGE